MNEVSFIPGLELSRRLFGEVVKPLIATYWPQLRYSAALIGPGSDVLGYDTARSMDHEWGPRLLLFLREDEYDNFEHLLFQFFSTRLPVSFLGFPTNFSAKGTDGTQSMVPIKAPPIRHKIVVTTIKKFFFDELGVDLNWELKNEDWLLFPQQRLLEITRGEIFHDGLKQLQLQCDRFTYFPDEVWRYQLAVEWSKLAELEPLVGRSHELNDTIGAQLIGGRIVHHLMNLCFLYERTYYPYVKWLGVAFRKLPCSEEFEEYLSDALHVDHDFERELWLVKAYESLARIHNALELTELLPEKVKPFYSRPYRVIDAGAFSGELWKSLQGSSLAQLKYRNGTIDQLTLTEYDSGLMRSLKGFLTS